MNTEAIRRNTEKFRNSFLYDISLVKREIKIVITGIAKTKKGTIKSEYLEDGTIRFV